MSLVEDKSVYDVDMAAVQSAFGSGTHGEVNGAFVELRADINGSDALPHYDRLPTVGVGVDLAEHWFTNAAEFTNVVQLALLSRNFDPNPVQGYAMLDSHISTVYAEMAQGVEAVTIHELGHQFDVANNHVDANVYAEDMVTIWNSSCVMSYHPSSRGAFDEDCAKDIRSSGRIF